MNWYTAVLKNYAGFSGRASRPEYWWYFLFNAILGFVLGVIGELTRPYIFLGILGIYELAVIVPSLAVVVRRLHDTNRSGGWFFITFVPLVGGIILLVFMATEGDRGPNQYGPDPRQGGGYPGQGYPQAGYPQQPGYPQQGYPQQPGYPAQPQGYPAAQPQGTPPQGYQPQGYPAPGYPQQQAGFPQQPGFPQQGYPGTPAPGTPAPGMPPQGTPPQGYPPQNYPPQNFQG